MIYLYIYIIVVFANLLVIYLFAETQEVSVEPFGLIPILLGYALFLLYVAEGTVNYCYGLRIDYKYHKMKNK